MKLDKINEAISNIDVKYLELADSENGNKKNNSFTFLKFVKFGTICICLFFLSILSIYAISMFGEKESKDLSIKATYVGGGKINVDVSNMSDKELEFQKDLKIILWYSNKEVERVSDEVYFTNTKFLPHESGVMTIDISNMYDIKKLEEENVEDDYYIILTNNYFAHGYAWYAFIDFYQGKINEDKNKVEIEPELETEIGEVSTKFEVIDELKPYFNSYVINPTLRNNKISDYYDAVEKILDRERENGKQFVTTVNPRLFVKEPDMGTVFDKRVSVERQYELIGEHHHTIDAYNIPVGSFEYEDCMVLSTTIPQRIYDINDTGGASIPLVYIYQYDINELRKPNTYVFIRGRILSPTDLEEFKIYEDDNYVSYNMTSLFYDNLEEHLNVLIKNRSDIYIDDMVKIRVNNVYNYLMKEGNIKFYYHN